MSCKSFRHTVAALFLAWALPAASHAADMGKALHITFPVAETGFDPVKVSDYYSGTIIESIFDPLLTYDYLARPAKLVPNVSESLPQVTDSGKTYTFKLRKGIYFTPDPAFKGKQRELTAGTTRIRSSVFSTQRIGRLMRSYSKARFKDSMSLPPKPRKRAASTTMPK